MKPLIGRDILAPGFTKESLIVAFPSVWAYFRQLSGKEVFEAAQTVAKEEVLFHVGYNPEIKATHVIRYKVFCMI